MGRKGSKHRPTYENRIAVQNLAVGLGSKTITRTAIARYLNIDLATLEKYYSHELETGKLEIFKKAVEGAEMAIAEGNASVINKILANIGGLTETQKHEVTGAILHAIDAPKDPLSLEEWKKEAIEYKQAETVEGE